jgi:hypothetical protein
MIKYAVFKLSQFFVQQYKAPMAAAYSYQFARGLSPRSFKIHNYQVQFS